MACIHMIIDHYYEHIHNHLKNSVIDREKYFMDESEVELFKPLFKL
jgi:hypothetical protein